MMSDKLNLFDLLKNIDDKNHNYYNTLPSHLKKQFSPFMVMQWLNCTDNAYQKIMVNEVLNSRVFKLYQHPELMYYLMTTISDGNRKFYKWKKPPSKQYKFPKAVAVLKEATGYSSERANESLKLFSNDDILSLSTELGYQKEQTKELQKELSKR